MLKNIQVYNPNSFKRFIFRLLPVALPIVVTAALWTTTRKKESDYDALEHGWQQSYTYENDASQNANRHQYPDNTIEIEYITKPSISISSSKKKEQYHVEKMKYRIEETDQEITEELINNILVIESTEELKEMVNYLGGEYYYQSNLNFTNKISNDKDEVNLHIYNTRKSNLIDEKETYYEDLYENSYIKLMMYGFGGALMGFLMYSKINSKENDELENKTVEGKKQKAKVK